MGGCMSCRRSRRTFSCVRVIHMNGYVEDFAAPVTAAEVMGKPQTHVLLSSAHLLSFGSSPLLPGDRLEPGRCYFLLPHSVFQSESSPVDLASLMNRLTAAAQRGSASTAPQLPMCGVRGEEADRIGGGWWGDGMGRPTASGARTWQPELDPIDERSFGRSMGRDSVNQLVLGGSGVQRGSGDWGNE